MTDVIQRSRVTGRDVVLGRSAMYLLHFELLRLESLLKLKLSSIGWLNLVRYSGSIHVMFDHD